MASPIRQAAAVPVRDGRVCMVTSRTRRRWVFPKGGIDAGQTPAEAAVVEAWEEAGLTGLLDPIPVGSYTYTKNGRPRQVTVYVLRVTDAAADWPERAVRQREWLTPAAAAERVDEPGLRAILTAVVAGEAVTA